MMKYKNTTIIQVQNKSTYAVIDWVLGNYCNYKCSYCFPNCNTGTSRVPKLDDQMKTNIRHLVNELLTKSKGEKIYFNLVGGEPTVYHDFENLIVFLKELGDVGVVTNGSRTVRWWEWAADYLNKVNISYHTEFSNIEHIANVVDAIKNKTLVSVYSIMNDKMFDKAVSGVNFLFDKFKEDDVYVSLKVLRSHDNAVINYTSSQKKTIDSLYKKIKSVVKVKRDENPFGDTRIITEGGKHDNRFSPPMLVHMTGNFKNYKCTAHQEFLQINANGYVGQMSCMNRHHKSISIYDKQFSEKFSLDPNPLTCQEPGLCGCLGLWGANKKLE